LLGHNTGTEALSLRFPGPEAGAACGLVDESKLQLSNNIISADWQIEDSAVKPVSFVDHIGGQSLTLPHEVFSLVLNGGSSIYSSQMSVTSMPVLKNLVPDKSSSKMSDSFGGKMIEVALKSEDKNIEAVWRAILRDGSNYIRQEVIFKACDKDIFVKEIILLDMDIPNARPGGDVQGSVIVTDTMFLGYEHPMAANNIVGSKVHCSYQQDIEIAAGESYCGSCVIGIAPKGQLRRAFLCYLERQRAHPYRPFLHYNSWYDIGFFSKYNESDCLSVIEAYGRELVQKRGVKFDSFLLDDGWDDTSTLWDFHEGFPQGFKPIADALAKIATEPGVWLGPWGGYGEPKKQRLEYGKKQGFEIYHENEKPSFKMSGAKYYKRFRDICLEMVREYGVNHFKFDGIGQATGYGYGAGDFVKDFDKILELIAELRGVKKDVFINLTTGTWPSPFWLFHADSIWRGGLDDHAFAGAGSKRQQWITFRDGDTYKRIVSRSDLYPLNSLMLHGVIYARHAEGLDTATEEDFVAEVRTAFGSGTQLQELYITPEFLTDNMWDELAASAKWARVNAPILVDTHWIGGDPNKLAPYGWAAWGDNNATVVLRNPSDKKQQIQLDAKKIFELPDCVAKEYSLRSPYPDQRIKTVSLKAEIEYNFNLEPFEVLVFDTTTKK